MAVFNQPMYENGSLSQVTGGPLRPGGLKMSERLLVLCELAPGEIVLDAGCGEGGTLRFMQKNFFVKVFGIDRSQFLLFSGRKKDTGLPLACALGGELPFADGQVDVVLAECSFSAMGDFKNLLVEYRRVLRPGGRLAISDIYARSPQGAAYMRSLPFCSGLRNLLPQAELIMLLKNCGFEVRVWEDHSEVIKNLSGQICAGAGSLSEFWNRAEPAVNPLDVVIAASRAKLGYYLLISEKVQDG